MTTHRHSRSDLIAAIARMGGASGIAPLLAILPGGASGGIGELLAMGERAVTAGPVKIRIETSDAEIGAVTIEIV